MKGVLIESRSWEKVKYFSLDNGFIVATESCYNGVSMVTRIEHGNLLWCACNGRDTLPESFQWILEWVKPLHEGSWQTVIVPNFSIS